MSEHVHEKETNRDILFCLARMRSAVHVKTSIIIVLVTFDNTGCRIIVQQSNRIAQFVLMLL